MHHESREGHLDDLPEGLRAAISEVKLAKRLNISQPDQYFPDQALSADQIVFSPGASLTLGHSSMDWVAIIADELVFPGGESQIRIASHKSEKKAPPITFPQGDKGENGGINGRIDGGIGKKAKKSRRGARGDNVPLFAIIAKKITFNSPPASNPSPVYIEAAGSDGGDGAVGGQGGDGGDGLPATPGFAVDVDDGGPWVCIVDARDGGDAGPGQDGRRGGRGGDAGNGGEVWIIGTQEVLEASKRYTIYSPAGEPGMGGAGGAGGNPGAPGGRAISPAPCKHGKPGNSKSPGNVGEPGKPGGEGSQVHVTQVVLLPD